MSDRADAVRAMIEAFNAADNDALRRSLHPEVEDDGVLFEFLALIGPANERTAQLGWSYFRFKDGLIVSTETFATESAARRTLGG